MTMDDNAELAAKSERLLAGLRRAGSLLVAYSGGTDSAFLAYMAHQALGEKMLAVIADSASLPRAELAAALDFTAQHGIPTAILQTSELDKPDYVKNDAQRCFYCKDELFTEMERERSRRGFAKLAYGMNRDDRGDFRPGQQAALRHGALAPLNDAALGKDEIRRMARALDLRIWDKPASACLSSRIEYGRAVTRENLSQVERAENALHQMGFPQVRVRHHGEIARIEIARVDLSRALVLDVMDAMSRELKSLGFKFVTLDTEGYRTGSMNDLLPLTAIKAAE